MCVLLCRFLGHLYAAEALISLDRISDAIAHLSPENVSDVSMAKLTSEQEQGGQTFHFLPSTLCLSLVVFTNEFLSLCRT